MLPADICLMICSDYRADEENEVHEGVFLDRRGRKNALF